LCLLRSFSAGATIWRHIRGSLRKRTAKRARKARAKFRQSPGPFPAGPPPLGHAGALPGTLAVLFKSQLKARLSWEGPADPGLCWDLKRTFPDCGCGLLALAAQSVTVCEKGPQKLELLLTFLEWYDIQNLCRAAVYDIKYHYHTDFPECCRRHGGEPPLHPAAGTGHQCWQARVFFNKYMCACVRVCVCVCECVCIHIYI
jgi:hypothetical protein